MYAQRFAFLYKPTASTLTLWLMSKIINCIMLVGKAAALKFLGQGPTRDAEEEQPIKFRD